MLRPFRPGFGLVELLVVLGIIGLLISLFGPAVQRVRAAADKLACQNCLRQLGLAHHLFHNDHGCLPPGRAGRVRTRDELLRSPQLRLSRKFFLLPYLDQAALYHQGLEAMKLDPDSRHNPPHAGFATVVRDFVCPTDGRLTQPRANPEGTVAAFTSYVGIGVVALPQGQRPRVGVAGLGAAPWSAVTDGLSQTILEAERPPPDQFQAGWWYPNYYNQGPVHSGPNNIINLGPVITLVGEDSDCLRTYRVFGPGQTSNPCDRYHLWSLHPGGANFVFADGHVRFLTYAAEPVIPALASAKGGEVVQIPE